MKVLADGSTVSERSYYFLLDYNDRNDKRPTQNLYGVSRIVDLAKHQYLYLFKQAIAEEAKVLEDG